MALSLTQDVTAEFNQGGFYIADSSNWDYLIWQFVGLSAGDLKVKSTNDSGAITGVTDGFALTSINYTATQATDLSNGAVAANIPNDGLFRIPQVGQFIKISGDPETTATKVIIRYHKFS